MPEQIDVLRELADVLGSFLAQFYRPNCCIAATRISTYVLQQFGIDAQPVVVRAAFLSAGYQRFCDEHGRYPEHDEYLDDVWSVGLGVPPDPDDPEAQLPPDATAFVGHMVADVRLDDGTRWVFDGSMGQGSRPDKGIPLPLVGIFGIDPDPAYFARVGDGFSLCESESRVFMRYERIATPVDYTTAKDWCGLMAGFHSAALTDYIKRRLACRSVSGVA